MLRMTDEVIKGGMTRDDARAKRKAQEAGSAGAVPKAAARKPFTYRFVAPGKDFRLELRFRRSAVERREIAAALREAADKVEAENGQGLIE
jgi:hypothetical protein